MSTPATAPTSPASAVADQLHAIRANWGWFVVLGIAFILLGFVALAHVLIFNIAAVIYVGAFVLVAGVVQVIHAFRVQSWGRFFYWLLAGLLYIVAGGLIMYNPLLGAGVLTLMIGVALAVEGIFRIFAGLGSRPGKGWGWIVVSGIVTLLLGLIIIARWPVNSVYILGLFLGVDLVVNGVGTLLFGLTLRDKQG
ncbi:HdeD family acid-resistance protein [Xanthobacter dioxanivorans]|uniref:HdeD family acid-resistance protein n=1 Tax=Xanthobacter dioxanivorans TaxID=2528964 RepID=A0A974PSU1_9HYPH|nr:HdeD family acid-resistance protein [Xanthobacter dioxanivorans]QRG08749.1 HdeD family acid-resistance protein [Xanthobacter dioxanivorans]